MCRVSILSQQKNFMAEKFNKNVYDNQFKRENYMRIVALIPKKDKDIIKFLESKKPISSYVYELIQKDFKQHQEKN